MRWKKIYSREIISLYNVKLVNASKNISEFPPYKVIEVYKNISLFK